MKTSTRIITAIAATAALAVTGLAAAHPGSGMGPGMGWGGGQGHMGWGPGGGMGPGAMGPGGGWGPGMGQGGMGPGMRGAPGMGGLDMNAAAAGRLAALKTQLKLTAAQEPAWKVYEGTVTQQATAMQAMRDQVHAQWQNAKPGEAGVDMAAQHQAMTALRQSSWQAQDKAFKDLYAALTPEQQALVNGGGRGPRGLRR